MGEVGGDEKSDATGGTTLSPGRWRCKGCSCSGKSAVEETEGRLNESRLYPLVGDSGGVRSGGAFETVVGSRGPNFWGAGEEGRLLSKVLMNSGG